MNKAAKGRRREYQAIEQLNEEGFTCTRSAASRGLFDIIAIKVKSETIGPDSRRYHHVIRCVQVKANKPCSRSELLKIKSFPSHGGIISKEVWVYYDGQGEPVVSRF